MSHPGFLSHNETKMIRQSEALLTSGDVNDPVEALRHLCLARGFSGFLGFGRIFHEYDRKGAKSLNMDQFIKAFQETGLELPEGEIEKIFNLFEVDGEININTFMAGVRVSKRLWK
jgi:calcyphosin